VAAKGEPRIAFLGRGRTWREGKRMGMTQRAALPVEKLRMIGTTRGVVGGWKLH
jgi:hypothetical protein